jgi:hypothetical protein
LEDKDRRTKEKVFTLSSTEEILKAYKEGFKDGYNEAVKFYIINPHINMHLDHNPHVMNIGAIGAAGRDPFSDYPLGANGPTGSDTK